MTTTQKKTDGVCQLRIYEVLPDKREIFHTRFKDHALRIMKRYGFEITALWESTSVVNFEFVYLLRWPDVATMDRQWKAFLADEEWIEIKRQTVEKTGEPVVRVTSRVLEEVAYSPVGKTG
jgi:NIPSNAP.